VPGVTRDTPHPNRPGPYPTGWEKRFHANADPGESVNLHVRVKDAPNRRQALVFRDWLWADDAARQEYQALKRGLAETHASDPTAAYYAEAKEPWFATAAPRAEAWARTNGWTLPD
jgi:dephospho-CoA kinase